MRDLKRPNSLLPAYKELGEKGIEIFTPMQWHVTLCQGKRMRQQRPFIPDLLFAHASRAMLDPLVEAIPTSSTATCGGAPTAKEWLCPTTRWTVLFVP